MNKTLNHLEQPELEQFEECMNNIEVENIELNNDNIIIHYTNGANLTITAQKELSSGHRGKAVLNCEFEE